jgi:hypothetical protein
LNTILLRIVEWLAISSCEKTCGNGIAVRAGCHLAFNLVVRLGMKVIVNRLPFRCDTLELGAWDPGRNMAH